jgi:carbamoyltransferase
VYYGPEFTERQIERALDATSLVYESPDHLAAEVARLLHRGWVVARFAGRLEYGPRALGNRSILYHGRDPKANNWLNRRLRRSEFMPFAPVTLWEDRHRYYRNLAGAEHAAEFMTITFDCTERMMAECPAAVHVDGTARPQLIQRDVNPGYYDVIAEYRKITGVSTMINTSFNMHEEPIVCTPADAVRAFLDGRLDALSIGPYLVRRPGDAPLQAGH